jgi:hypothetical protein
MIPGVVVVKPVIKEPDQPTVLPAPKQPWRGPMKLVRRRDYSHGSIRDFIIDAQTAEELDEVRQLVMELIAAGTISSGTLNKLGRAVEAKERELANRLVVGVGGSRRLVAPRLIVPGR